MSESMWGVLFVIMGVVGIFFISIFENVTSTNDQNYYLLKETTEAAMWDSIDLATFRNEGKLKIIKEKFVENFTRRFAESTNIQKNYNIKFYEIIEEPPKVTIEIAASSQVIFTAEDFDIINVLDAILETEWDGSITNPPNIGDCVVNFVSGYLEEYVTYTRECTETKRTCVKRSKPGDCVYGIITSRVCTNIDTGKTRPSSCPCNGDLGNLHDPRCERWELWGPLEKDRCTISCEGNVCTKYETTCTKYENIPNTESRYIEPQYQISCAP